MQVTAVGNGGDANAMARGNVNVKNSEEGEYRKQEEIQLSAFDAQGTG